MMQKKRHHFVPKAYLKAFCDKAGRLLVYRKDKPDEPLHVAPDATQFRGYYYSQSTPDGGVDNNTLENFFSEIESDWPQIVAKLHRRENVTDNLEVIFQFIALQRARVPANRDVIEAALASTVKATMKAMLTAGTLPPPPDGLEDLSDQVEVAIDPHQSLHAMVTVIQGMSTIFDQIGLVAIHNATSRPFLTSDNPVAWFDPSQSFESQLPYTVSPNGPIALQFPISPTLLLLGATQYKEAFAANGLLHDDASDDMWVEHVNAQTCRFGYEAVISQGPGQEHLIGQFAEVSPVHQAISMPSIDGAVLHRQGFGPRAAKPKWRMKSPAAASGN
jgi:hypothetical protein